MHYAKNTVVVCTIDVRDGVINTVWDFMNMFNSKYAWACVCVCETMSLPFGSSFKSTYVFL